MIGWIGASLTSCDLAMVDPAMQKSAEQFVPPPVYARWWGMVEECAGVTSSFSAVSWYSVPGTTPIVVSGKSYVGYWSQMSNRIVIESDNKLEGDLVRHEMLHAVLQQGSHPRADFLERCGGIVACNGECVTDSSPAPVSASVVHVAPDEMEVAVAVVPESPGLAIDGGVFSVIVTTRNPADHAVVVDLPVRRSGLPRRSYGVSLTSPAGGPTKNAEALDLSVTTFQAGEAKRKVFDFAIAGTRWQEALAPGVYTVEGNFGRKPAESPQVTIAP